MARHQQRQVIVDALIEAKAGGQAVAGRQINPRGALGIAMRPYRFP